MDFNATIDLIIKDLDEARKIIDDLKKYPGVPPLQVELAKSKCKSAGEVIAMLKELNVTTGPEEVIPVQQNKEEKKVIVQEIIKPVVIEKPQIIPAEEIIKDEPSKAEVVSEHPKKSDDSSILGDSFSHLSNRVNEQLSNLRKDDDVSSHMNAKPISSLAEAIGLNDKFLFMKEIFNGDKEAYSQAIARLESSTSLADAKAVVMSYTGNNEENEAVKQLIDLVKRKLPSNE